MCFKCLEAMAVYPSVETHFLPVNFWVYELAYDLRKEHVLDAEAVKEFAELIEELWGPAP